MTLRCTLKYIPKHGRGGRIDALLTGNEMIVENQEQAIFEPGDRFELENDGKVDTLQVSAPAYSETRPNGMAWHIPVKRWQDH